MPNAAIKRWKDRLAAVDFARLSVLLSRLLLLVVAVELLTMPLTQLLWSWDGFLHGGQDFELGLFVIVSCVCLVLLRAQDYRQKIRLLLSVCLFHLGARMGGRSFRLLREPLSLLVNFLSPAGLHPRPSTLLRI